MRCIDCVESAKMASHPTLLPPGKTNLTLFIFFTSAALSEDSNLCFSSSTLVHVPPECSFCAMFMFWDYIFLQQHQNAVLSALFHRKIYSPRSSPIKTPKHRNARRRQENQTFVRFQSLLPNYCSTKNSFTEKNSNPSPVSASGNRLAFKRTRKTSNALLYTTSAILCKSSHSPPEFVFHWHAIFSPPPQIRLVLFGIS